jgi:hypothetical protein
MRHRMGIGLRCHASLGCTPNTSLPGMERTSGGSWTPLKLPTKEACGMAVRSNADVTHARKSVATTRAHDALPAAPAERAARPS